MSAPRKQSSRNNWETPQALFDLLHAEFHFTVDAAASEENAKCPVFWTEEDNALEQDWDHHTVFCNPPYGKANGDGLYGIDKWLHKAHYASEFGNTRAVVLTPCDPSTYWFSNYEAKATQIRLCCPRVHFVPPEGVKRSSPPATTAVWIFGPMWATERFDRMVLWRWSGATEENDDES